MRKDILIEIANALKEINMRLGLRNEVLDIESYKPGNRRLYRIVLRDKSNGSIIAWSRWLYSNELRSALELAVQVLRYVSSHCSCPSSS